MDFVSMMGVLQEPGFSNEGRDNFANLGNKRAISLNAKIGGHTSQGHWEVNHNLELTGDTFLPNLGVSNAPG